MMTTAVLFQVGCASRKLMRIDEELLLINRIGVSRVSVLISLRLQKADCGLVASGNCGEEIVEVVLVVGLTGVSDFGNRCGAGVSIELAVDAQ